MSGKNVQLKIILDSRSDSRTSRGFYARIYVQNNRVYKGSCEATVLGSEGSVVVNVKGTQFEVSTAPVQQILQETLVLVDCAVDPQQVNLL